MKLEDLERDILGAYLNYENNDLKTAVKQLDIMCDLCRSKLIVNN